MQLPVPEGEFTPTLLGTQRPRFWLARAPNRVIGRSAGQLLTTSAPGVAAWCQQSGRSGHLSPPPEQLM